MTTRIGMIGDLNDWLDGEMTNRLREGKASLIYSDTLRNRMALV